MLIIVQITTFVVNFLQIKHNLNMNNNSKIIYTITDEAPALATYSLLPIIETFANAAGIEVETSDISLAARILAAFSD